MGWQSHLASRWHQEMKEAQLGTAALPPQEDREGPQWRGQDQASTGSGIQHKTFSLSALPLGLCDRCEAAL